MAIAAMFTKEIAITLPLALGLYEFYFLKTQEKLLIGNTSALFGHPVTIIPVTMLLTSRSTLKGASAKKPRTSPARNYLLTQFRVIVTYIRLVFLPIIKIWIMIILFLKAFLNCPSLSSFLFLTAILFGAKRLFSKYRMVSFSIFWFFLTLCLNQVFYRSRMSFLNTGFICHWRGIVFFGQRVYYLFGKNSPKAMVLALV